MNILCVCAQGLNRSKMAARLLAQEGHTTDHKGADSDAPNPITQADWDGADAIVFARERHQKLIHERFGIKEKEFILDVTDSPREIPEIWVRAKLMNPDKFYEEYTLPRIQAALQDIIKQLPLESNN